MKMKRWISLLLVMVFICSVFVACDKYRPDDEEEEPIDPTKTQLTIMNFEGGFVSEWLDAARRRFEKMYKDTEFEPGKKGVQTHKAKAKNDGQAIRAKLDASGAEIFFNESVYYYDYLADDLLLEITDMVEETLTRYGETRSVADKMTVEQKAYYLSGGRYYGVPHYAGYNGIMYDCDLFDEYGLWFRNSEKSEFVKNDRDTKSAGPDGVLGTPDDGFPATYDEFFMLCDYMVAQGITPFVWAGEYYDTYVEKLIYALAVDHDGLQQTMLNYTLDGTATSLISEVGADGSYTKLPATEIGIENGYDMWRSEGKYLALKFVEKLVRNGNYYTSNAFSPALLYTEAQKDFVESRSEGKPIAMMIEGCWWENETKSYIREVAERTGDEAYAPENRRFGMMPLPKANRESIGKGSTIVDTHYSLGFIKKSIDPAKIPVAKLFLQFVCTDESLQEFSVLTNTVKALDYTVSEENLAKMTYFGRSVYQLHHESDVVYPYSAKNYYLDKQSAFSVHNSFNSLIDKSDYARPVSYLKDSVGNHAEAYFNGMYDYRRDSWKNSFGRYFR